MNPRTETRNRSNWRWLIPIFMLLFAALACDESYLQPPQVWQVEADTNQSGLAYAEVDGIAYETSDYGQHWQRSEHLAANSKSLALTMRSETLYLNDRAIWSFPRPTFRQFFLDDSSSSPHFLLPSGKVSNSLQGDVLYVAMGTEGVLVAHMSGAGALVDWQVTANGIDALKPLPLTLTKPVQIVGVTAFGLLVPPYFLLHGFLLYCLWVYVLPRDKARYYAIVVTGGLMLVAAVATVIWLADARTDFYPIVAVVTAIAALTGMIMTLVFADEQPDSPRRWRLVVVALLISLIVPAGVAAIFVGWWAVYLVVFGFALFRRAFWNYFQPEIDDWRQRWRIDRLAIETLVAAGIMLVGLGGIVIITQRGGTELGLLMILVVTIILLPRYAKFRLQEAHKAKREDLPYRSLEIRPEIVLWLIFSGAGIVGTLFGQMIAYGWFTSLIK